MPNSYLIHPGDVLQIPERAVLEGTEPTLPGASSATPFTAEQIEACVEWAAEKLVSVVIPATVLAGALWRKEYFLC